MTPWRHAFKSAQCFSSTICSLHLQELLIARVGMCNFILRDKRAFRMCIGVALILKLCPRAFLFLCSISKAFFVSSPCHLGVPYNHVSVRVLGDTAFLRVEVEDFCRVAACDGYKSILVHFAAVLREEMHKQVGLSEGGHSGWRRNTELAGKRSVL